MIDKRESVERERVLIVGLYRTEDVLGPDRLLDELAALVESAGGVVVGRIYQRRPAARGTGLHAPLCPATYIGRGKAHEVGELVKAHEAQLVIFDNELSPAQIRELEELVGCRVLDRSELILDIFASRARTKEAKLQVELAQLEYTAPRLRGMWTHLERQAGSGRGPGAGVGTRGPGEKQIEIDRRIVSERIGKLRGELERIQARRERMVAARGEAAFSVGLVGYTNAGKSTLMNALTGAGTLAANQLFATLDTKVRRWAVAPGIEALLSDTVGFVRDLPHHLVASFRSTLAEALGADLLLHVIDASHPQALEQVEVVETVLAELGADQRQVLCVLNKIDAVQDEEALLVLRSRLPSAISVSARTGTGLDLLAGAVARHRRAAWVRVRIQAPHGAGKLEAFVRARGTVHSERYDDERWVAEVDIERRLVPRLETLDRDVGVEILEGPGRVPAGVDQAGA